MDQETQIRFRPLKGMHLPFAEEHMKILEQFMEEARKEHFQENNIKAGSATQAQQSHS